MRERFRLSDALVLILLLADAPCRVRKDRARDGRPNRCVGAAADDCMVEAWSCDGNRFRQTEIEPDFRQSAYDFCQNTNSFRSRTAIGTGCRTQKWYKTL